MRILTQFFLALGILAGEIAMAEETRPIGIIFDTDMGNDIDDALALGMLHALEARGQCRLLAVTLTKDHPLAAPYVDAVNTFYGRGDLLIGMVRNGVTPEDSKYLPLAQKKDGDRWRYPHDLLDGSQAPEAVWLIRRLLAAEPDQSVNLVQVGFSTNFLRLLTSGPDEVSALSGKELLQKKVRGLFVMAGAFTAINGNARYCEYNVIKDIPAAQKLAKEWPTPMVWSGFEIGIAAPYPAASILRDYQYVAHHPLAESYHLYEPPPHTRPTWDLTAALEAVWPDRGYFERSPAGQVIVEDDGFTRFEKSEKGLHRYLILPASAQPRLVETLVLLSSQPPARNGQ